MDTANRWPVLFAPPVDREPDDPAPPAILADHLGKARGSNRAPINCISFCIAQGEFFGLIGPAGAGKTALMRMFATLSVPDSGRLYLLGHDAHSHASLARRGIGYMARRGGIDPVLTGEEHVRLAVRLHGLGRGDAARRVAQLLGLLDLRTLADRRTRTYPIGARRRLALACALAAHPRLLLLDDPTSGLPPTEQQTIRRILRVVHVEEQATVILATDQLEEAEALCGRVGILDAGRLIALGSLSELQAQVSGATVTIHLAPGALVGIAAVLVESLVGVKAVWSRPDRLEAHVVSAHTLPIILRLLEEHEIPVRQAVLGKSSLDEVFFRHTGRTIRDAQPPSTVGTGAPESRS
ncbi:MAG: ATP-binding cassette domain-containing protein [Chloroflexota bacterium]